MDGIIIDRGTPVCLEKDISKYKFAPTNLTFFGACFFFVVKRRSNILAGHLLLASDHSSLLAVS
jgi:hypothetical protein